MFLFWTKIVRSNVNTELHLKLKLVLTEIGMRKESYKKFKQLVTTTNIIANNNFSTVKVTWKTIFVPHLTS